MEPIYLRIWELARPFYERGRRYDIPHIEWMMVKAYEVGVAEGARLPLLLPIVILHDVGYSAVGLENPNGKDPETKLVHMREGALIASDILDKVGYDPRWKGAIVRYIAVHDNWVIGDDSPFFECREMALFNDLDFLYMLSNREAFATIAASMGMTVEAAYRWWQQDEKLVRRPFCCATTRALYSAYLSDRKQDLD